LGESIQISPGTDRSVQAHINDVARELDWMSRDIGYYLIPPAPFLLSSPFKTPFFELKPRHILTNAEVLINLTA
ncbi:MAG: hypothetical protein RQ982_06335, partial [Gammaproteobacteria bacterium]|nr:hypothetical protein [Gammaproteobacteria bacterium]